MNTHIYLTSINGYKLLLSKANLCISVHPLTNAVHAFYPNNIDDEGWIVTDPIEWICKELNHYVQ